MSTFVTCLPIYDSL